MRWFSRLGALRLLWSELRLALRLLRDPRVPVASKALPVLALLYAISPADLVPDLIPVLGQLDDLTLLLAVTQIFRRVAPPDIVAHHQSAVSRRERYAPMPGFGEVIDAEWRRDDV